MEHPLDLVEFPFLDRHPHLGGLPVTPKNDELRGHRRKLLVDREPLREARHILLSDLPPDAGEIGLIHMGFRGEQPVGEKPVVRDEQEPLGVLVETPDREEVPAGSPGNQVENCRLIPVLGRRHHAGRLVQHEIFDLVVEHRLPLPGHPALRHNLCPRVADSFSLDGHAPLPDPAPNHQPCPDTHVGKIFVKPHTHPPHNPKIAQTAQRSTPLSSVRSRNQPARSPVIPPKSLTAVRR